MTLDEIRKRVEACNTDDGINHGKKHLEDCFDCTIEKYEDGFIYCPLRWSGRTCEECMEIFQERTEKYY